MIFIVFKSTNVFFRILGKEIFYANDDHLEIDFKVISYSVL